MRLDGANLEAITRDFDAAMAGFSRLASSDPALWSRARPGGWTAGQHVAHIAVALEDVAAGLEDAERIWTANPFRPAWHYRLPEALRMHAVHARHHAVLIEEIARDPATR